MKAEISFHFAVPCKNNIEQVPIEFYDRYNYLLVKEKSTFNNMTLDAGRNDNNESRIGRV